MTERTVSAPSSLQLVHAGAFSCGLVATLAGVTTSNPYWHLVGGPCLALSGALILVGCRITFRGPVGQVMRAALGSARVTRLNLRGIFWLLAGILLSVWGVQGIRSQRENEPQLQAPMVQSAVRPSARVFGG
jgi:CBS-domain-containing membrane protein